MKKLFMFMLAVCVSFSVSAKPQIGDLPFDTLGKNKNGEIVNLSDHKGKVVIVTFWATWCHYCMKEIPVLEGIQKQVSTEKLQVIAVSHNESRDVFKSIIAAMPDVQTLLVFDKGLSGRKFGVEGIPHMVIIGKDGKIAAVHVGYAESELPSLVAEINKMLRTE